MPDTTTPDSGTTPASTDAGETFWAEQRARGAAERGYVADPSACGTCRDRTAHGRQVEHEQCAQRATLLQAPDHPGYELLTYQTEEEAAALPARFHTPVFLDSATPKSWVCAVCWGDGWITAWPCPTAQKHGMAVFTPEYRAEQDRARRAAELFDLRVRIVQLETAAAVTGALKPVGYYCDHSDEPYGARTHHGWEWDEENGGRTWQHLPNTISEHSGLDRAYLKPEDRDRRCPRATLVYVATPAPAGAEGRPGAVEYGIRVPAIGDWPSVVLPSHGDLAESTDRLARYLDSWPGAVLAVRSVAYGEWAAAPVADSKTPAGETAGTGEPDQPEASSR